MVERICPQCQHGNALDNRFCGHCGASLERNELAPRQETSLAAPTQAMPVQLKQVGQTVAVSLAALAAEAGLAWLRRRVERVNTPEARPQTTAIARAAQSTPPAPVQPPRQSVVTVFSQRIVEVWDRDGLARQTIERSVWRREG